MQSTIMNSWVGLVIVDLSGMVIVAYLSSLVNLEVTTGFLGALSSAALTVGSILIAVLGVLASLFVTQNLKGTVAGRKFAIMIGLITLGMTLSFVDGVLGLYAESQSGNATLVDAVWVLFTLSIYSSTISVIGSMISILK